MADYEENEPFLTGDDAQHEDLENDVPEVIIPASKHFKRAVKGLNITVSALSGLVLIISLGIFISIQVSPLNFTWSTTVSVIDLVVCVSTDLYNHQSINQFFIYTGHNPLKKHWTNILHVGLGRFYFHNLQSLHPTPNTHQHSH